VALSPAWGIHKTQRYNTLKQETTAQAGNVYVVGAMSPIWDITLSVPLLTGRMDDPTSEIATFNGLFGLCKGAAKTFLLPDPNDNTVTNFTFGTGDGVSQTFQLTRPVGADTQIVQNVNGVPSIFINGVATSLYTIDDLGVLTFNTAPAAAAVLSWSGQFLFRCKFKEDTLADMQEYYNNAWSCSTIDLESVNL
jgi:hypothetical protein